MSRSFHNKILRVNLTKGTTQVDEPGVAYFRRYMGGWNIIADTLLREVPAGADPLGPDNKLIFAPGVLTGMAISGSSRNAVGGKSPLTGAFGATEVGGFWGADLKRAGFDAIIVEGVSPNPVYLWVKDGKAEIRDASHLWGKTTKATLAAIREELGDSRISCTMIGPGGENMVRYACVMNGLKDAGGRAGLGAVMGSKNLKAVAARGTLTLDGEDPETIRDMARRAAREVNAGERSAGLHARGTGGGSLEGGVAQGNLPIRNFRDGEFPEVDGISFIMDKIGIGMEGCYACAVRCKKVVKAETEAYSVDPDYGGPEYESIGALGSTCGVSDIVAVSRANELCNAYSLDTIGAGVSIAFAMECFENGLLTLEDTDGIDLKFGNADGMLQMIEKIGKREGLGALLAKGTREAARVTGKDTYRFAIQNKGLEWPGHTCRPFPAAAVGYATGPRGGSHHDIRPTAEKSGLVDRKILEGKGALAAEVNHWLILTDSMLLCHLAEFIWGPTKISGSVIEALNSVTGWELDYEGARKIAERQWNMIRCFSAREGFTREDDQLPVRFMEEPVPDGPMQGIFIPKETLERLKDDYYSYRGWDLKTGNPTKNKLVELGLDFAAEDIC